MVLVSCRECGAQVSNKARACPACGMKGSRSGKFWWALLLLLLGYPIVNMFFYDPAPARLPKEGSAGAEASPHLWGHYGERAVKDRLKDAGSAEFRAQFVGKENVPCGEVNSKNSFGGYPGYQRYLVALNGIVVFETDMPDLEFEKVWAEMCK